MNLSNASQTAAGKEKDEGSASVLMSDSGEEDQENVQVKVLRFQLQQQQQRYEVAQESVTQLIAKIKELKEQREDQRGQELESKEKIILQLHQTIKQQRQSDAKSSQLISELRSENFKLGSDLKSFQAQCKTRQEQYQAIQARLIELTKANALRENEVMRYRASDAAQKKQLQDKAKLLEESQQAVAQRAAFESRAGELQAQVSELQKRIQTEQAALATARNAADSQDKEIAVLRSRVMFAEQTEARLKECERQRDGFAAQLEKLTQENVRLALEQQRRVEDTAKDAGKKAELEASLTKLKEQVQTMEAEAAKEKTVRAALEEAAAKQVERENAIKVEKQEVAAKLDKAAAEVGLAKQQCDEERKKYNELSMELEKLKIKRDNEDKYHHEKLEQWAKEKSGMEQSIKTSGDDLVAAKAKIQELEAKLIASHNASKEEMDKAQMDILNQKQTIAKLRRDLQRSLGSVDHLQNEMKNMSAAQNEMSRQELSMHFTEQPGEVTALKARIKDLELHLQELTQINNAQAEQSEKKEAEALQIIQQLRGEIGQYESIAATNSALVEESNELRLIRGELETQVAVLQDRIDQLGEHSAELQNQLDQFAKSANMSNSTIVQTLSQKSDAMKELAVLSNDRRQLSEENQQLRSRLETDHKAFDAEKEMIVKMKEAAEARLEEITGELERARSQINEYTDLVAFYKQQ